jgi:hypothetical protein
MGVYRYDYLVLGWKLKQEILKNDFCEDLQYDTVDSFFLPENGEYVVYGKLVEMSDCITGFDLLEMDVKKMMMWLEDYDKLSSAFREATNNELLDWVEHDQAKLYLFSLLQ